MSSSKIIKMADHESSAVSEFNFRSIGQAGITSLELNGAEGFVPMGLLQNFDLPDTARDNGPPLIEISESDLDLKISDSFNSGLKEGKDLAERGLINVFRALRASSETIHNLRDKIFRESEDEIINLVMLVARRVIIHEISQDRSILTAVVQNALSGLSAREEITVLINPDDYLLATTERDDLLHNELLNDRLLLKPDPSVASGFCLVETTMGTVDASLDGQMDQIYRSLIEHRTVSAVEET